jgi:hypothetical protein
VKWYDWILAAVLLLLAGSAVVGMSVLFRMALNEKPIRGEPVKTRTIWMTDGNGSMFPVEVPE